MNIQEVTVKCWEEDCIFKRCDSNCHTIIKEQETTCEKCQNTKCDNCGRKYKPEDIAANGLCYEYCYEQYYNCKDCEIIFTKEQGLPQCDGPNSCIYYKYKEQVHYCYNPACSKAFIRESRDDEFCYECDDKIRRGICTNCNNVIKNWADTKGHCEYCSKTLY